MYIFNKKKNKLLKNRKLEYYNFMKWNKYVFIISIILIILSFIIIYSNKFNWSLDFTGGTKIELNIHEPINNFNKIKFFLQKSFFLNKKNNINFFKEKNIFLIKLSKNLIKDKFIKKKLLNIFNNILKKKYVIKKIEFLGPSVDNDFILSGITAIFAIFLSIWLYIGFRFEWYLAFSTIVSLIHDIIISMGIISLLHIEIDLNIITSIILIINYSLNDSIIILDRIRENYSCLKDENNFNIINLSINQIIKRSILTSSILLTMLLNLYFFGGLFLKNFIFIMIIGVIIGTISSIYIMSAIALITGINKKSLINK
ncbi:protein translocase subunit SecF [Enterobacteriaceae endosymbiont of Donacia cinerea]|uniref:protein translocase subunit SecF n=1 Tax=Enterobacteriaceae endosymbiont of Donacia cinerea TaxID=2675774 RepID=UPI001449E765|nr:protein translocase subunit SecF [Enterobacteriaceae endosymbiont of Donacia cinerea]QJC34054.1 protein translocase subunit SecF [Enterobacteriaceae endosymbiont of Donacia cinerea]